MTKTEFKKLIAESGNPEWFKTKEIKLLSSKTNFNREFNNFLLLYDYLFSEEKKWENCTKPIPKELNDSKNYFINLKSNIEKFVNDFAKKDPNQYNYYWSNHETRNYLTTNNIVFEFDQPETTFLIDIYNNEREYYLGAFYYFTNQMSNIFNKKENFIGASMANDFIIKESSIKYSRKDVEQKTFQNLKKEFQDTINEASSTVVDHLKNTNDKYEEYVNSIEKQKEEKDLSFQEWFTASKKAFENFDKSSTQKIKELEKTYQELLRLKEPANYWKQRATTLKEEGWLALKWLTILILFGCVTLYFLLWQTPEGMLKSFFSNDKATAIKWSIVFVTFISFLAFGIKALSKVMFSSFHLSRDAEEREHLTYVYLSLIKDTAVEKEDRNLIMQALFSRADSGLLKEDSTPAMPGMVEKVMQR